MSTFLDAAVHAFAVVHTRSSAFSEAEHRAGDMPISRPAVSQHLKVLRDAGLVQDAQEGRHRVYSIDAQRLTKYRRALDKFWSDALGNLAAPTTEQERGIG